MLYSIKISGATLACSLPCMICFSMQSEGECEGEVQRHPDCQSHPQPKPHPLPHPHPHGTLHAKADHTW